jgi:hypothetical protein
MERNPTLEWVSQLRTVIEDLDRMSRSTEADFLAITEKLTGILAAARAISGQTREMAGSLAGDSGEGACQALMSVLEDARHMEQYAAAMNRFVGIRDEANRIRVSLSGLQRVGPSFHAVATLAKIETAHLGAGGRDLGHLAEAFQSAGTEIQSRVEHILGGATALENRVESTLAEASEFDRRVLATLPALLAAADQGLATFRARQQEAAATISRVAAESEVVAKAIGDIVTFLQFHDITRQQLQHVMDALEQLTADSSSREGLRQSKAKTSAVIDLQLAQLANASAAFEDAIRQMDERLGVAAGQVKRMVEEGGPLAGGAESGESGFYAQMESCLRAVTQAAAGCKSLEQQTQAALAEFGTTLEALRLSASEVKVVELRLFWLAINAAISAAHIGLAGEPLETVADGLRRLVAECDSSSSEAEASIDSIAAAVRSATEDLPGPGVTVGDTLLEQLRARIDDLHDGNEQATVRKGEIARMAFDLSAEVDILRSNLSAGRVFTATIQSCTQALRRIQAQSAGTEASPQTEALKELRQHYTMQAEREIHDAVAAVDTSEAEAVLRAAQPAGGEFGDNVELF